MSPLSLEIIQAYRRTTHRYNSDQRLTNPDQAVDFVNERGFIYFWPIANAPLPSLWGAVAGDRPVPDEHDDPGHVTWGWKDDMLGKKRWYYGKVLRKRGTLISLEIAPYFYALTENYGSPEEDYLTMYYQGKLTQESKLVFEALLKNGPLDTLALRREAHLTNPEAGSRFERALTELQTTFQLLPVGVADAGVWHYAYLYDLLFRHHPEIVEQARYIGERQARKKLVELYFRSMGAAQLREVSKIFGWPPADTQRALDDLCKDGVLQPGVEVEGSKGEWYSIL